MRRMLLLAALLCAAPASAKPQPPGPGGPMPVCLARYRQCVADCTATASGLGLYWCVAWCSADRDNRDNCGEGF